ncbi:hypothetical protein KSF_094260 [Reticulibacter mediterranei]|uniref:Uncharacterized protein n=1 Tax=Reticulibacter mediterranei TaxID=2778369 RepID=A0A8J3IS36_9CHLR|nr:hypothetical protein [Reticulibacter mediterranei]GHO99378.1 hypothetical protein KSF_094260 [Reticulibacter mediterranei]
MPSQEERIEALERTTAEFRPVLQNVAYELTMVKGLTIDQIGLTQNLNQDMKEVKERLTKIEEQLETILTLLKPS